MGTEKIQENPGGHCGVHMWALKKYGKDQVGTVAYTGRGRADGGVEKKVALCALSPCCTGIGEFETVEGIN